MTSKTRKTYIGKERDDESYLGDFGVRKYDYAAGRFTALDMLWEKYMGWSPYNYSGNNPISSSDPSGLYYWVANSNYLDKSLTYADPLKSNGTKIVKLFIFFVFATFYYSFIMSIRSLGNSMF